MSRAFDEFAGIVERLRSPDGCPWDRLQTFKSLAPLLLEETYELLDSIEKDDHEHIKEELGDLMLHIVMFSQIGKELGMFDLENVINGIKEKIIQRHPHIFGDVEVSGAREVLQNWEKIKLDQKRANNSEISVLSGVPSNMPALIVAQRVQEKASRVGFDWERLEDVIKKAEEEFEELKREIKNNAPPSRLEEELGDLLFAVVNVARFLNISAELSLRKTVRKFKQRFEYVEKRCSEAGLENPTLKEMDNFWEESKKLF